MLVVALTARTTRPARRTHEGVMSRRLHIASADAVVGRGTRRAKNAFVNSPHSRRRPLLLQPGRIHAALKPHTIEPPFRRPKHQRSTVVVSWADAERRARMRAAMAPFPDTLPTLPPLTDEGLLPPGDYAPSRSQFERSFVDVGNTTRRAEIYAGWNRHRNQLQEDGLARSARELLDGSFTSSAWEPRDIDIVVEYPVTSTELRMLTPTSPIIRLLQGGFMKGEYDCDAYPLYSLPEEDPAYEKVTIAGLRYWTKWFGRTRLGLEKGRIWASVGGFDEHA